MTARSEASGGTDRRRRADESVATRFTRPMNAATSPWGVLCDPPFVALTTAILLLAALGALELGAAAVPTKILVALVAMPTVVAVVVALRLRNARAAIVEWLATLPFAVDNVNALLNGLGGSLEIQFADTVPAAEEVNPRLDAVHSDCFVTDAKPDDRRLEIRIGVLDSKRNPHGSTHRRYRRCRDLVEKALVPLAESFPIASVRVK